MSYDPVVIKWNIEIINETLQKKIFFREKLNFIKKTIIVGGRQKKIIVE